MAWLRRDEQTTTEGEQEWISDLLNPLHGHGDNADDATETDTEAPAGTTDSAAAKSGGGTPRRSVADVIAQADPLPRTPHSEQAATDEPNREQPATVGDPSNANEADSAATRSAADVLAAANRTGETIGTNPTENATEPSKSTDPANTTLTDPETEPTSKSADDAKYASEAELPANYATRVPTTGEIPSVDETDTNIIPTLAQIMQIDGALGTALVDYASGETLARHSIDDAPDMALSAAAESAVIRTKIANLVQLDSDDDIDEVFTTLGTQYHLTRMVRETETSGLFLYLILDRELANLAMARHKLALAASQLEA